jgi:hypothetical protein
VHLVGFISRIYRDARSTKHIIIACLSECRFIAGLTENAQKPWSTNINYFLDITPYRLVSIGPLFGGAQSLHLQHQSIKDYPADLGWLYLEGRPTHRQACDNPTKTENTKHEIRGIRVVFRRNNTALTAAVPCYRSFAVLLLFCWRSELGHVHRFSLVV